MRKLAIEELKEELQSVIDAAERGETTVVTRDGEAIAVVGPARANVLRPDLPGAREPGGLQSVIGILSDWETIEEDMAEVVAMRRSEFGRPPPDFE